MQNEIALTFDHIIIIWLLLSKSCHLARASKFNPIIKIVSAVRVRNNLI